MNFWENESPFTHPPCCDCIPLAESNGKLKSLLSRRDQNLVFDGLTLYSEATFSGEMVNLNCQIKYCILDPLTKYIHMYLYLNINCIQGPPIVPTSPLGHFELQQLALFVLKSVSSVPIPISVYNGNSPCFISIICANDNLS